MIVFFDTSALLKTYYDEAGSSLALRLWNSAELACASVLLAPEVLATVARKRREGDPPATERRVTEQFRVDWISILPIGIDSEVLGYCADLLQRHALRGADTVHLASALYLKSVMRQQVQFASGDLVLIRAAEMEGLEAVTTL